MGIYPNGIIFFGISCQFLDKDKDLTLFEEKYNQEMMNEQILYINLFMKSYPIMKKKI